MENYVGYQTKTGNNRLYGIRIDYSCVINNMKICGSCIYTQILNICNFNICRLIYSECVCIKRILFYYHFMKSLGSPCCKYLI